MRRTRTASVALPQGDLLSSIVDVPLEYVFDPHSSISAVAGIGQLSPDWRGVSARWRMLLSDGHQAAEAVLSWGSASSFTHPVSDFTNVTGRLADCAIVRPRPAPELAPASTGHLGVAMEARGYA